MTVIITKVLYCYLNLTPPPHIFQTSSLFKNLPKRFKVQKYFQNFSKYESIFKLFYKSLILNFRNTNEKIVKDTAYSFSLRGKGD